MRTKTELMIGWKPQMEAEGFLTIPDKKIAGTPYIIAESKKCDVQVSEVKRRVAKTDETLTRIQLPPRAP